MAMNSRGLRHRALAFGVAGIAMAAAGNAHAQSSGEVFNEVFNVGGARGAPAGFVGDIGCGGTAPDAGAGGGASLTTVLNSGGGQVDDVTLARTQGIDAARSLWRFCDNMQGFGGAWFNTTQITAEQELAQNKSFAPDQLFALSETAAAAAGVRNANIYSRVGQLRVAALDKRMGETAVAANTPRSNTRTGLNAGDGPLGIDGLAWFFNGRYSRVEADTNDRETGSDTDGFGFTAGVDYATQDYFAGVAFGYTRFSSDFDQNSGDSDIDDLSLSLYGAYFINNYLYVDGLLGGSYLMTDTKKNVVSVGAGGAFAPLKSDPDGYSLSANLGVGAELEHAGVKFNPYARFAVLETHIDSFNETGGDGTLALSVGDQDFTSLTSTLGIGMSTAVSTSFGVVSPYLRIEYVHEFKDQADDVSGFLVAIPQATFNLRSSGTDRNYGNIGAGIATTFTGGLSAFVDVEGLVGYKDLNSYQVTAGIRKEF